MSNLIIDLGIFILLILSVGFGGIGVLGLLLFPDIRSRMYTAVRATLISIGTLILSVIIFALFIVLSGGGDQYSALIIHSLALLSVVAVANAIVYRAILNRTKTVNSCHGSNHQNMDPPNSK
jgi:multisubunit Na+/H+ antiporter MnhG subunit